MEFTESIVAGHLRHLQLGLTEPQSRSYGVCQELVEMLDVYIPNFLLPSYPSYSGNLKFPVIHPTMRPERAYVECRDLWADNEYGSNRRDFCGWLADQIIEEKWRLK